MTRCCRLRPTLYLDHHQGSGPDEPPGRGDSITLADVYAFDPTPHALSAEQQRHIIGRAGQSVDRAYPRARRAPPI